MPSLWQKTMFYLGLTAEEELPEDAAGEAQAEVRTVPTADEIDGATTAPDPAQPAEAARPGAIAGRRVEPPTRTRRRISGNRDHAEAGMIVRGERSLVLAEQPESEILVARTFSDAQRLADLIRYGNPVVLDLRSTEPEMVRRLVDFSSGLTYALDGTMRKIGQGVIFVAPQGASLDEEERERLAALDLYQAPDRY